MALLKLEYSPQRLSYKDLNHNNALLMTRLRHWSTMQVPEGVPLPKRPVQTKLINIIQDHCLSQMVNIHTREDQTLDLLITNSPSPINRVKGMPPIGKADHDIVYIEYEIKAKRIQLAPRKIFLYKRADMDGLHDHLACYRDLFLSTDHIVMCQSMTCGSVSSRRFSRLLKGLFHQK